MQLIQLLRRVGKCCWIVGDCEVDDTNIGPLSKQGIQLLSTQLETFFRQGHKVMQPVAEGTRLRLGNAETRLREKDTWLHAPLLPKHHSKPAQCLIDAI